MAGGSLSTWHEDGVPSGAGQTHEPFFAIPSPGGGPRPCPLDERHLTEAFFAFPLIYEGLNLLPGTSTAS